MQDPSQSPVSPDPYDPTSTASSPVAQTQTSTPSMLKSIQTSAIFKARRHRLAKRLHVPAPSPTSSATASTCLHPTTQVPTLHPLHASLTYSLQTRVNTLASRTTRTALSCQLLFLQIARHLADPSVFTLQTKMWKMTPQCLSGLGILPHRIHAQTRLPTTIFSRARRRIMN
jgi:hypothetical protein